MAEDVTPSIADINRFANDPEVGTGKPAVVFDNSQLLNQINADAKFKAQNDWNKYTRFLDDLGGSYKNLQDTASMEVATPDRPYLEESAKDIFSEIVKNPKAIYSPELNNKLGKLRSDATESKQNQVFDMAHRKYIAENPDLNTPENQQTIESYWNSPLGARKPYGLNMPVLFDMGTFSEELKTDPSVAQTFANSSVTPDNQFIIEREGTNYKKQPFLQRWNAGLQIGSDKKGRSVRRYAQSRYNELPENIKAKYDKNGGLDAFWNDLGNQYFGATDDFTNVKKEDRKSNPNYLDKDKLALERQKIAQGWKKLSLDERELELKDKKDESIYAADSVLREAASIIAKGTPIPIANYDGRGNVKEVVEVSDPNVLKEFGNIDKDGRVTNVPDGMIYDKDKDEIILQYYKPKKDQYGRYVIERNVPLNPRSWLKTITKRSNPNKDIGKINEVVEQVFSKSGSLNKLSDFYFGGGGGSESSNNFTVNGKPYTKADLNKLGYTDDQIAVAIKNGTIKQ